MRAVTPKSRLISKPWLPPVSPSDHKVAQEAEKAQVQPSAISKIKTSHPELDRFAAGTGAGGAHGQTPPLVLPLNLNPGGAYPLYELWREVVVDFEGF